MHRTTNVDNAGVKHKQNNLIQSAHFPPFHCICSENSFPRSNTELNVRVHGGTFSVKSTCTPGIGRVRTKGRQLAMGVGREKNPCRASSNIQRPTGHGHKGERRSAFDPNHCSAPQAWGDENHPSQPRQPLGVILLSEGQGSFQRKRTTEANQARKRRVWSEKEKKVFFQYLVKDRLASAIC